ncbi:hypothetical protein CBA19C6_19245 [Cupriavidus pauculus]|nr:hypothetical protein CBA19C6_19245 [Cupriavidus pauculus]
MTVSMSTKKSTKSKAPKLVSDDLIDQLLAQVKISASQAWPACSRSGWPSACWPPN